MPHELRVCAETEKSDNAFLRAFSDRYQNFVDACLGDPFARRYCVGDLAENFLNTRLNCERDWNPAANAISLMRRLPFRSRSHAVAKRVRATYSTKFMPVTRLKFSLR